MNNTKLKVDLGHYRIYERCFPLFAHSQSDKNVEIRTDSHLLFGLILHRDQFVHCALCHSLVADLQIKQKELAASFEQIHLLLPSDFLSYFKSIVLWSAVYSSREYHRIRDLFECLQHRYDLCYRRLSSVNHLHNV